MGSIRVAISGLNLNASYPFAEYSVKSGRNIFSISYVLTKRVKMLRSSEGLARDKQVKVKGQKVLGNKTPHMACCPHSTTWLQAPRIMEWGSEDLAGKCSQVYSRKLRYGVICVIYCKL